MPSSAAAKGFVPHCGPEQRRTLSSSGGRQRGQRLKTPAWPPDPTDSFANASASNFYGSRVCGGGNAPQAAPLVLVADDTPYVAEPLAASGAPIAAMQSAALPQQLGHNSPAAAVAAAAARTAAEAMQAVATASAGMTSSGNAAAAAVVSAGAFVARRRLYRVLTAGLGVRVSPDVSAPRTGDVLLSGEIFEAAIVAPGVDGRVYLKPRGLRGWVFDDSAVDPADPSVEPLSEEAILQAQTVMGPDVGTKSSVDWGPSPVAGSYRPERTGGVGILGAPLAGGIAARSHQPPVGAPFQHAVGAAGIHLAGAPQHHRPTAWGAVF